MERLPRQVMVLGLLVQAGCGGADADAGPVLPVYLDPIAVLNPSALVPVEAARDPLAEHRPPQVDCLPATWGPEAGGFEVQTGACNYAAFDQPLPVPLVPGDLLEVSLWHDLLDAPEPATAHVAVWVDETVLWEAEVDIPAPWDALESEVRIPAHFSAGARLGLHLHNHGFNSWRFLSIELRPIATSPPDHRDVHP